MFLLGNYVTLAIVILVINIVPLLMPPTWSVLAFFYIKDHLDLLHTVILGAVFATIGRIILYWLSKKYFRKLLSKRSKQNYLDLGKYLNRKKHLTILGILTYAFFPIPSNQVFIAAGLASFDIKILATCFFLGRLISYSFWVSLTARLSSQLAPLYNLTTAKITIEIFGLIILILLSQIPWGRYILKK